MEGNRNDSFTARGICARGAALRAARGPNQTRSFAISPRIVYIHVERHTYGRAYIHTYVHFPRRVYLPEKNPLRSRHARAVRYKMYSSDLRWWRVKIKKNKARERERESRRRWEEKRWWRYVRARAPHVYGSEKMVVFVGE